MVKSQRRYNNNQSRSKSKQKDKSDRKSQPKRYFDPSTIIDEADFQRIVMDIDIAKPRSAYNFYMKEMSEKEKERGKSVKITEVTKEYAHKWNQMSDNEIKKYEEMAREDEKRYQDHLNLVKKFLIAPPLRESATGFSIFCDTMVAYGIERGQDPRDAREDARLKWRDMSNKDKDVWLDKAEENKEFYDDLKNFKPGFVSAYTLFVRDKRLNGFSFKEIADEWKKASDATIKKYEDYAAETNDEKMKKKHLWEMANGIKPMRPKSAYSLFLMDFAKTDRGDGKSFMTRGSDVWRNLSENEREAYFKQSKKESLIYMIKNASYKDFIRKIKPSSRGSNPMNIFISENKHLADDKELPQGGFLAYMHDQWRRLSESEKQKYKRKADESKKEALHHTQTMRDAEYTLPKRPPGPYSLFIKERYKYYKEKNKNLVSSDIFKMAAKDWPHISDKEKEEYEAKSQDLMDIYRQQVNQFKTLGYYTEDGDPDYMRKPVDRSKTKSLSKKKGMRSEEYIRELEENDGRRSKKSKRGRSKSKSKSQGRPRSRNSSKSRLSRRDDDFDDRNMRSKSRGRSKSRSQSNKKYNSGRSGRTRSKGRR